MLSCGADLGRGHLVSLNNAPTRVVGADGLRKVLRRASCVGEEREPVARGEGSGDDASAGELDRDVDDARLRGPDNPDLAWRSLRTDEPFAVSERVTVGEEMAERLEEGHPEALEEADPWLLVGTNPDEGCSHVSGLRGGDLDNGVWVDAVFLRSSPDEVVEVRRKLSIPDGDDRGCRDRLPRRRTEEEEEHRRRGRRGQK